MLRAASTCLALTLVLPLCLTSAPTIADAAPRIQFKQRALPEGSAAVLALLANVAQGRTTTPITRRAAARIGSDPRSKALAAELVAKFNGMPTSERAALFPRIKDTASITRAGNIFEQNWQAKIVVTAPLVTGVEALPPQTGSTDSTVLSFVGVRVIKPSDPDGSDEVIAYASLISAHTVYNDVTYSNFGRSLYPAFGATTGLGANSFSAAAAGPLVDVPYSWLSEGGFLMISAVIEDDGDAAADRERLDLLLEAALILAPTFPGDELRSLEKALEYSFALLRVSDPKRWPAKAVEVRRLTWDEYTNLYHTKPKTTGGVPHKLKFDHEFDGGVYSAYYDVPHELPPHHQIAVRLGKVEALGPTKDYEDGVADFGARVTIDGASSIRDLTPNLNSVDAQWTLTRSVIAGGPVDIKVEIFENDAPTHTIPLTKTEPIRWTCDVNPIIGVDATCGWSAQPCKTPVTALHLTYDPASGKVSGDLSGSKGQTLTATGDPGARQARVSLSITHK